MDIDAILAERKAIFEHHLESYLAPRDAAGGIWQACAYSLRAGGKRLRPVLTMLACEAAGGSPALALPAGLAIEMIHTFSLIHDDLPAIDNDDLRRGQPTCHRQFGEAAAILAGDALIFSSMAVICAAGYPAPLTAQLVSAAAAAGGCSGLVQGEYEDILAEGQEPALEAVLGIYRRKTAALFELCLRSGALLAGARAETVAALAGYGRHLGLAFQVIDDILDITADPAILGKTTGKDRSQGKATLVTLLGLEAARSWAGETTAAATACLDDLHGDAVAALRQLAAGMLTRVM